MGQTKLQYEQKGANVMKQNVMAIKPLKSLYFANIIKSLGP